MWTVVLRSQRTVTSSAGKWTTVKYPADQMNILCFLSATLEGLCKHTAAFTPLKCQHQPVVLVLTFTFLRKRGDWK